MGRALGQRYFLKVAATGVAGAITPNPSSQGTRFSTIRTAAYIAVIALHAVRKNATPLLMTGTYLTGQTVLHADCARKTVMSMPWF